MESLDLTQLASIAGLSLRVSFVAVVLSTIVGLPLGCWMGLRRHGLAAAFRWLSQLGMALPPVLVGLLLYILLSRSGPLGAWDWLYTARAMIAAQFILALPFVTGITATAVSAVPRDLAPQLRMVGASRWQATITVLTEARGGVALAIAAAFGRSISEVGAVLIVGGNIAGHTRVLTTAIVLETSKGNFEFALALGGVLLAIAGAVNLCIVRYQGRFWICE